MAGAVRPPERSIRVAGAQRGQDAQAAVKQLQDHQQQDTHGKCTKEGRGSGMHLPSSSTTSTSVGSAPEMGAPSGPSFSARGNTNMQRLMLLTRRQQLFHPCSTKRMQHCQVCPCAATTIRTAKPMVQRRAHMQWPQDTALQRLDTRPAKKADNTRTRLTCNGLYHATPSRGRIGRWDPLLLQSRPLLTVPDLRLQIMWGPFVCSK